MQAIHQIKESHSLRNIEQYEKEVLSFVSLLFKDITKEKWEWEFLHSPEKSVIKVYIIDGKVIGHYALIAFPMLISGKIVFGAKAEGSLVDIKAIRKLKKTDRNVFGKLIESCLVEFSNFNKFAVFGFPNSKALASQLKHGYKHVQIKGYEKYYIRNPLYMVSNMHFLVKPFFIVLSLIYKKLVDFIVFLFFSKINTVSRMSKEDANDLNNFSLKISMKSPDTLMIHRTYQYYKWRIINNPYNTGDVLLSRGVDGEIDALIAFSIEKNKYSTYLKIQDIAILDRRSGRLIFNKILSIMKNYDIDYLVLWELDYRIMAKTKFSKLIPFVCRKSILDKNMIFYSNLFKDFTQRNFDVSLIYKRF